MQAVASMQDSCPQNDRKLVGREMRKSQNRLQRRDNHQESKNYLLAKPKQPDIKSIYEQPQQKNLISQSYQNRSTY